MVHDEEDVLSIGREKVAYHVCFELLGALEMTGEVVNLQFHGLLVEYVAEESHVGV